MPAKRSAMLRWTGMGTLEGLKGSVEQVLRVQRIRGRVRVVGRSLAVIGPEPVAAGAALRHTPGVAWVAVGFATGTPSELAEASSRLARAYLKRGSKFSVTAEGGGPGRASDAAGAVVSRVLDAVKGARVSDSPKVRFRVAMDGARGVVGVELSVGPGGAPVGRLEAACLVSGGEHSSVVAWMALLAGFRVKLVHARVDRSSVLAVARLYSELSNRGDPRALSLEVLEGGSPAGMLGSYLSRYRGRTFTGFRSDDGPLLKLGGGPVSPLLLMTEERFRAEFASLGIKGHIAAADWSEMGSAELRSRRYAGGPASVSEVLDGLA